jgi:hypothetical protein
MQVGPAVLVAFALGVSAASAEPVGEEALGEIYESCVSAALGASPALNAAMRMRYCFCVRDEVQRSYTAEALEGLQRRVAGNAVTDADHDLRERIAGACRSRAESP